MAQNTHAFIAFLPNMVLVVVSWFMAASSLVAVTFEQSISSYHDNQGWDVQGFSLSGNAERRLYSAGYLSAINWNVNLQQQQFRKDLNEDDEFIEEMRGHNSWSQKSVSLQLGQNWQKLTDTRVVAGYSNDEISTTRTAGVGASHWFLHETLQLNLDFSRTIVQQPVFEVLDADSDIIAAPARRTSSSVTASLKNLATPTTTTLAAVTYREANDRPPADIYQVGVRQYIVPTNSAIHLDLSRGYNTGNVTTRTNYGEVDSWTAEIAYLQGLWQGSQSRLSYRFYKEDEITRVERQKYTRASDTISMSLNQELKGSNKSAQPTRVHVAYVYYQTNDMDGAGYRVIARLMEVGLNKSF